MSKLWWYLCFFVIVVSICDDLVALKSKQIKVTDKYSRFKQRKWFLITADNRFYFPNEDYIHSV